MESFISVDEIKINCNFNIGRLKQLSIKEKMYSHTIARIEAGIESGSLQIAGQEFNSHPIVIEAVKEGKRILLFSGVISEISLHSESLYDTVAITAYSLSWFMDLEKKSRSFQGEHSVLNFIQKICRENSFMFLCTAEDEETEAPFIQYRETDWEFLLRVASHLHAPFYTAGDYEDKGVCLGLRRQESLVELETVTEKWRMDTESLKLWDFDEKKALYYEVTSDQILHLGQSTLYHNQLMWPFEVNMTLHNGLLHCSYKLSGVYYHTVQPHYNPYLKGVSLEGTVLERKGETIKVHLDIDEEQEAGNAHFYSWLPEHGNMLYCMPEEESKVRLLIAGEDERYAFGTDCVRQNGSICKETQITDHQWFMTNQNKSLNFQPSCMELSDVRGKTMISFQDSTGNRLKSSENILIQAEGNIFMQGTKVRMNAPTEITVIKRETGDPAVVNICHNLDAMGKQTAFYNLEEPDLKNIPGESKDHGGGQALSENLKAGREEEKKKLQFELQKLLKEESEKNSYELGASIVNVISAIPQCSGSDRLSQIAIGFRPIAGRIKM